MGLLREALSYQMTSEDRDRSNPKPRRDPAPPPKPPQASSKPPARSPAPAPRPAAPSQSSRPASQSTQPASPAGAARPKPRPVAPPTKPTPRQPSPSQAPPADATPDEFRIVDEGDVIVNVFDAGTRAAPSRESRPILPTKGRVPLYATLGFRRTIIPILLTLGVSLPAL